MPNIDHHVLSVGKIKSGVMDTADGTDKEKAVILKIYLNEIITLFEI